MGWEPVLWKNCNTYTIIYDCMICTPHVHKGFIKIQLRKLTFNFLFDDEKPVYVLIWTKD